MVERRKGKTKLVYNKTKKIIEKISPILCQDMMSWNDLADRVLELEAERDALKKRLSEQIEDNGRIHDEKMKWWHEADKLRAELQSSKEIQSKEKLILISEIENNAKLRDALRHAADEPNIDKARAISDKALEEK